MKKIYIAIIILLIIVAASIFYMKQVNDRRIREKRALALEIKSHYNDYISTNKDSNLYDDKNNIVGSVSKDTKLILDKFNESGYFKIKNLDLYINYIYVDGIDSFVYDDRYKNYIPFNINIKTKNTTKFYDSENNLLYSINKSYDFPVIIKDTDKYGIIFNDQLLYVESNDVEEVYDNKNTDLKNKKNIRTITYHFLYDPNARGCNEGICLTLAKFEEQIKYIRENDYFTLRLPELELYMDGKLQIPEKSIVLTIDDGTVIDPKALELLDQYKVNMTLFLITGWMPVDMFQAEYLDIESHTNDMHTVNQCSGWGLQGGGILCLPYDKVMDDLKQSQEALGGSVYFAYPFFDHNDRAIGILKDAGFHMAFVGSLGTDGISTPGVTDKFKMRRKTMFNDVSMNEFINEFLN